MKRNYEAENEIDMAFRLAVENIDDEYLAGKLKGSVFMAYYCDLISDKEKEYILDSYLAVLSSDIFNE